jgi:membrane protein implicated in regulation of membrane protease activity
MPSWTWLIVGLFLLGAEAVTPGGFFLVFFGLSAILVGTLAWIEAVGSIWMEWLLFSVFSVLFLMLVRPRLVDHFSSRHRSGNTKTPDYLGEAATLLEDLDPGAIAKAELRGTSWTVRSHSSSRIIRGTRCRVERIDGLTLWISPEAA